MPRLRIAIVESPNPIDLFEERSEARALVACCRLMGHQSTTFFVRSRREFQETVKYLASSDSAHAERFKSLPFFLHLSSHGNSGCVALGKDLISWEKLVDDIGPLFTNPKYRGMLALSISSCGSGSNTLSRSISEAHGKSISKKLPAYIFSIHGESVHWDDALIAWNLLYLKISKVGLKDRDKVIEALKGVQSGTGVRFSYSRWSEEDEKYFRWSAPDEG